MRPPGNLLCDLPDAGIGEVSDTVLAAPGLRSAARLRFADEEAERALGPGDWVHIAAHRRHRVAWTDPEHPTVWLAVFHE